MDIVAGNAFLRASISARNVAMCSVTSVEKCRSNDQSLKSQQAWIWFLLGFRIEVVDKNVEIDIAALERLHGFQFQVAAGAKLVFGFKLVGIGVTMRLFLERLPWL